MVVYRIGAEHQVDVDNGKHPDQIHDDGVNEAHISDSNPMGGHGHQHIEPIGLIDNGVERQTGNHLDKAHEIDTGIGDLLQWIMGEIEGATAAQKEVVLHRVP